MALAILNGFMAITALSQMAISVGKETASFKKDNEALDKQLNDALNADQEYKDNFRQIMSKQKGLTNKIINTITDNLDKIIDLQEILKKTRNNAVERYKVIQFAGITFVSIVLFMYILKFFNVTKDIADSIENFIKNLFRNKKNKK